MSSHPDSASAMSAHSAASRLIDDLREGEELDADAFKALIRAAVERNTSAVAARPGRAEQGAAR